ncbi:hypothetical protein EG835_09820 [bacterium]|nr:hypothetical protein [bacterium]
MSSLGVMLDATLALYGMEMNYVHRPMADRSNCYLVKWTPDSITRICWNAEPDHLEFSTRIHLHGRLDPVALGQLVELLNTVTPAGDDSLVFTREAHVEHDDLIVESSVVIEDSTYVGQVEQAYLQALQDIMSVEATIS